MFPTSPYKQHFLSPRLPHYAVFLTQLVQHKLWDPFPRPECSRKESQTSPKIWLLACQSWSAQAHSACLNTGNKKYLSRALPFDPSKAIYVGSIPPNVMDDLGTSFQAFGRICCVIPMSSETALVVFFTPELLLWYFSPISSREVPNWSPSTWIWDNSSCPGHSLKKPTGAMIPSDHSVLTIPRPKYVSLSRGWILHQSLLTPPRRDPAASRQQVDEKPSNKIGISQVTDSPFMALKALTVFWLLKVWSARIRMDRETVSGIHSWCRIWASWISYILMCQTSCFWICTATQ